MSVYEIWVCAIGFDNVGFVLFFVLYELQIGADSAEETDGGEDGSSIGKRSNSQQMSQGSVPKNSWV